MSNEVDHLKKFKVHSINAVLPEPKLQHPMALIVASSGGMLIVCWSRVGAGEAEREGVGVTAVCCPGCSG